MTVTLDIGLAERLPFGFTWSSMPRVPVTLHHRRFSWHMVAKGPVCIPGHAVRGVPDVGAIVIFGANWPTECLVLRSYALATLADDLIHGPGTLLLKRLTLSRQQLLGLAKPEVA